MPQSKTPFMSEETFKKFEDLSEQEKKQAYMLAKLFITESFNGGVWKPVFIRDNISKLEQESDLNNKELQEAWEVLQACLMKKTFGKDRKPLGFNSKS